MDYTGEIHYVCQIHKDMNGSFIIEEPQGCCKKLELTLAPNDE